MISRSCGGRTRVVRFPGIGVRSRAGRCVARALAHVVLVLVPAAAQGQGVLAGRVLDEEDGSPVPQALLHLRALTADGVDLRGRSTTTAGDGAWRFGDLAHGRYRVTVERLGYRSVTVHMTLERDAPLVVSILVERLPVPLAALTPRTRASRGPSLVPPQGGRPGAVGEARAQAERVRQEAHLSSDVRQLGHADVREAGTLLEDDVFRAFQRVPGVATRDDYSADLWTRGGSAGHTALLFDGIPLIGGLHALGILSGPSSDMLASATLQPGVAPAALQGGGAGVLQVESRSPANAEPARSAALSPVSVRLTTDGGSERHAWAVGARRSYVDALSLVAGDLTPGSGRVPYAFADLTGRVDVLLSERARVEASGFWQDDRVFGDVADVARGNEGEWGARVARAALIHKLGAVRMRHVVGWSAFDASVRATPAGGASSPLHPATENHYRTVVWESRVEDPSPGARWSVGLRASRERHEYSGPGIDPARLLSPDELARRGIGDLIPLIVGLERAHLLEREAMTRVALWGERRTRLADRLEISSGLRVETGDRVERNRVRLAPRLHLRFRAPGSDLALSAAYGRAYQYVQSVARTDVLRSGLRASEVLAQSNGASPALHSDVVTLGAELWRGPGWLLGATAWLRVSAGILVPLPTPGAIDGSRPAVAATGRARGVELSARRLEGRVRGFANYSLSRSRHATDTRSFDAPEDRRHVANLGVMADVRPALVLGATLRAESGAPYTRITLIDAACEAPLPCGDVPRVLFGAPGGQRAPAYASLDLVTEWTRAFDGWSLAVYGQLRNALGSANAVTYHSSCICAPAGAGGELRLGDRFDRGLPRLPIIGVRARFRE